MQTNGPKVEWPAPPAPDYFEHDKANEVMLIPDWWWIELATFYVNYDAAVKRYNFYYKKEEDQ